MAERHLRSILSRVVDIKPGEEGIAVLLFLYFFFITSPYYIIKSLRNASFLDRLTDARLPLAYFLTAVLMGLIVNFHSRLQVRLARRSLIVGSLGFFIMSLCIFWWLLRFSWPWVPVAFWVWANIFAIVLVTQFWILVNDTFNPREAKRLIGFIGSGAQLGAILGGVIAGMLARTRGSGLLLPLAAGLLTLGVGTVAGVFGRQERRAPRESPESARGPRPNRATVRKVGFRDALRTTRASTYLKLLAGIMIVTWVVSTLIDYQFNSVVSRRIEGGANLTAFFGFFNAGTMAFAFLFQLLLTSRIIKTWGIRVTLLIYPLALLFFSGGMGIVAYASILPAILLKTSDKSLAYSLNQSVRELLYIPISPEQKYKSKIFIDMFLNRFAKGLGAVILMGLLLAFPRTAAIRYISVAVLAGIAVWIGLNLRVGREYRGLVKDKLELERERGERLVAEAVDVDTAKLVFDTLESRGRSPVLYSMNIYDLIKRDKLTPEVKKLIVFQPDEVRASLGTVFEQDETGLGLAAEDEWEQDALKKDVGEIMDLDAYQEVMRQYIGQAVHRAGPEGEVDRMEAARAIGFMGPQAPAAATLEDFIEDQSPEVSRLAVRSAGQLKRREDVPALVRRLPEPTLREDVIEALVEYGPRLVGTLSDYLHDPAESPEVRQAAARVLGRVGTQDAADFLLWELGPDDGPIDGEIIDGLDMIRAGHPEVLFARGAVKNKVLAKARAGCRGLLESQKEDRTGPAPNGQVGPAKSGPDLLRSVFQLLGLIYAHEDIARAYQSYKGGTRDSIAYAIELLDTVLEKELRDAVFPLVEELPLEERLRRCRGLAEASVELKKPE
jgi:AAA family ATP:ADP antiporter